MSKVEQLDPAVADRHRTAGRGANMPMMGSLRGMARQGAWSIHVDDRAGTGNEQLGNSQGLSLRPPQSTTKLGKCLVSLPGSGPGEELLESCA